MSDIAQRLAKLSPEKRELLLKKLREQQGATKDSQQSQHFAIPKVPRDHDLPMSFAQERLWLDKQLKPESTAYTIANAVTLSGHLDYAAFERSLQEIIRRHEILRTTFAMQAGQPVQVIAESVEIPVEMIPADHLSSSEKTAEIERILAEERGFVFDLTTGPLLRFRVLKLNATEHVFFLTMHHIITDKWAMSIFIREMAALYGAFTQGAPSPLPELPVQYADFALWERRNLTDEVAETQLSYWKQQLAGIPPVLTLPTDRPRFAVQAYKGAVEHFALDAELTTGLKALSRDTGATLFMTVLAAFALLLSRHSGQDDIVIGSPIATRRQRELESLLGFFLNNLLFRIHLHDTLSFRELLQKVKQTALDAYAHQDIPFERLVHALQPVRTSGVTPLFQVMFVLENVPMESLQLPGLTLTPLEIESMTADYDFVLSLAENDQQLTSKFVYNADLFEATTVRRLIGHFQTLLREIAAHPKQRIATLPMLSEDERQQIVVEWNATGRDYPSDACIHDLFEAQVARTPDATALEFDGRHMTYRYLNAKANQLAHYLQASGVGPDVLVGICVTRSFDMVIGLLGVLKAGGAYVPLDPAYPEERLAFMIEDTAMPVLLTQEKLLTDLPQTKVDVVCLDRDWDNIAQQPEEVPTHRTSPENLAYVIYTSGSTGKPKGVLLAHRGLCNLAQAQIREFAVQPGDRMLQFVSFSFDVATSDVVTALCSGATLCLVPQEALLPGPGLLDTLRALAITHVEMPSSILNVLPVADLPDLRVMIVGGEACPPELVAQWAPGRRFFNAYGPTETTVCVTVAECADAARKPPIGRPLDNVQIYLLDAALQPVPIGVPGEMYIGGVGVAKGYLHRPDLTAEAFIANPFDQRRKSRLYKTGDVARYRPDGNLEFVGRVDYQVKIRGFRIEVEEIEAVLNAHSAIDEAAVVVREAESGDKQLLAYVTAQPEQTISVDSLRTELKANLPNYMIPSAFIMLERLPLTPNGKIDRQALAAIETTAEQIEATHHYVAPRTPVEELLAIIWSEILGREQIGIHDNFFDVGGHSLLTIQLMLRIHEVFQIEANPRYLFDFPTVAELAHVITTFLAGQSIELVDKKSHIDLNAEAVLDPAIQPASTDISFNAEPSSIFLTGTTGFLGAYLLSDLLKQTSADVYCLVRSKTPEEAEERLRRNLTGYCLWNERLTSRIIPVPGDLAQPLLGLSEEEFEMLAQRIDVIYHNGAALNLVAPYPALKAANVRGTQEILRLACRYVGKPVHYISTLSVFDSPIFAARDAVYESDPLESGEIPHSGYAQTKWVAETMTASAGARGLPVGIYRPGLITGHRHTGIWNTESMACKVLKGCIQLGKAPVLQHFSVDITPVDYVSQAIVHLSQQPTSIGQAFHIVTPHLLPWRELLQWVNEFGYPLQVVPYEQWQTELIRIASSQNRENALYPLLPLFLDTEETPEDWLPQRYDCQQTLDHLAETTITCPKPDDSLLRTYFSYFVQSGFLPPPAA